MLTYQCFPACLQAPSETPGRIWSGGEATPAGGSRWDAAEPGAGEQPKRNRWDATPTPGHGFGAGGETPAAGKRSRWDATPAMAAGGATPAYGAMGATPAWGAMGATPAGGLGMETPTPGMVRSDCWLDERCCLAAAARLAYVTACLHIACCGGRCSAACHADCKLPPPCVHAPACRCCSTAPRLPLRSAPTLPAAHPPLLPCLQLAAQQAAMGVPMTPEAYQQAKIEREMDERNR